MIEELGTYLFYTVFGLFSIFAIRFIVPSRVNSQNLVRIDFAHPGIYFFIFVYACIVGLRFNVGVDYELYSYWYYFYKYTGKFAVENELGFQAIIKVLSTLNFPSESLFWVIALLQIFFLTKAIDRLAFLRGWYLFFFFTCLIFFVSMNVMRQTVAYFIFFWGYFYFLDRKYLKYAVIMLVGVLFHKTIIIPAVGGIFLRGEIFKKPFSLILLLIVGSYIFPLMLEIFFELIFPVVDFLGYGYYIKALDLMKKITEETIAGDGLSYFLFLVIDSLIIFYLPKLKHEFKYFIPFFNLYIIGALLSRVFVDNFVFLRIAEYFISFRALMLSFLCYYLWHHKGLNLKRYVINSLILSFILLSMLAFFYKAIFNNAAGCRPWNFSFI